MNRKTPTKMTKWEAGQELIKAHDCLAECAFELEEEYPEMSRVIKRMSLQIGSIFNAFGSHSFGLADLKDLKQNK